MSQYRENYPNNSAKTTVTMTITFKKRRCFSILRFIYLISSSLPAHHQFVDFVTNREATQHTFYGNKGKKPKEWQFYAWRCVLYISPISYYKSEKWWPIWTLRTFFSGSIKIIIVAFEVSDALNVHLPGIYRHMAWLTFDRNRTIEKNFFVCVCETWLFYGKIPQTLPQAHCDV